MPVVNLPSGIGESLGDYVALSHRMHVNAEIWYVHHTGSDAYDGRDRMKPLATVDQALTNSDNDGTYGDIIVLLDGHTETITSTLTVARTIVGAGSSGGIPTATLTGNLAGSEIVVLGGFGQLLNIRFGPETQANSAPKIVANSGQSGVARIRGCYIEGGQYDDAACIQIPDLFQSGGTLIIEDTTIVSVGTLVTAQPYCGLAVESSDYVLDALILDGVTFDNGTVGWSNLFAADISTPLTEVATVYAENISLLRGADIRICASSKGYAHIGTSYGGARVDWTADCEQVPV